MTKTKVTFKKLDEILHGELSSVIRCARAVAEAQGFGRGYAYGKDRILGMVGWECHYQTDGSPEQAGIRKLLKSSEAYYAAIKKLEAECIRGNERHLDDLEREGLIQATAQVAH